MSLNIVSFKDAPLEIIDGDRGKNYPKKNEFKDEGHCLFLNAKNVTDNGFDFTTNMYISEEKDNLLKKGKLRRGDIVLTTRGTVGNMALYDDEVPFDNVRINSGMLILRPQKEIINEFLYWSLKSDFFKKQIFSIKSGTAQPQLPITTLNKLKFYLPNLDIQKEIVDILSNLNEKIIILKDMNDKLEKIIKIIFNYWFLQFDFPNISNRPFNSSGGKMIYNSELDFKIPKGWTIGSLDDIAEYINGLPCQKHRPIDESKKLPVIKITEMHEGFTNKTEFVRSDIDDKHIINDGDILFSWSATLETMIWTGGKGGLNQHIFKVIPKDYGRYYVYMMLSTYIVNFVRMAESRKTTMGHITKDHLLQSKIPLPPKDLTYKFDKLIYPLFEKIIANDVEIRKLDSLMEFILPLLMSGKVGFDK